MTQRWRVVGELKFVTCAAASLPFGSTAVSPCGVRRCVARQFISVTSPRIPESTWIQSPTRKGRCRLSAMPENRSASVLCSARPMTTPKTPEAVIRPVIVSSNIAETMPSVTKAATTARTTSTSSLGTCMPWRAKTAQTKRSTTMKASSPAAIHHRKRVARAAMAA